MKKFLVTTAVAAMAAVAVASVASAAPAAPRGYVAGHYFASPFAFPPRVSYGTGYHGTGSLTGGPAGGLPSRN